jgi:hypothetical protein
VAISTIPGFKAALLARLQADTDLDGVQITYGLPYPRAADKDWVWVADARAEQSNIAMGTRRRDERWNQEILVSCVRTDRNDQQTLTERAFEIADVIGDSLRDWAEVTGNYFDQTVIFAGVVGVELEERVSREQRESLVTITVACQNQL